MGINGLWDVLGEGEVTPFAELAANHFLIHNRPLRVAIDEAGWRFANLTPLQVKLIREKEPAANPIEKAILQPVLEIMKLNIQVIFVFDGPKRPWKRGKAAGRIDFKTTELLKKLLHELKVPTHVAPAEAEAECAKLQQAGIVDACWSEDGDALMFGCTLLYQNYRDNRQTKRSKSHSHVRVYDKAYLSRKFIYNREQLVLFVLLSGGDYDMNGVRGCGPNQAYKAMVHEGGVLARSLCQCETKKDLAHWLLQLVQYFGVRPQIPHDFPKHLAFQHYNNPVVCSDHEVRTLRHLKYGWDQPIEQDSLQLKLKKRRAGNVEKEDSLLTRITFDSTTLVPFTTEPCPPEEDWSRLETKTSGPFVPTARVECELLDCVLRHYLPESIFAAPPPPTPKKGRKRKAQRLEEADEQANDSRRDLSSPATRVNATEKNTKKPRKRQSKPAMTSENAQSTTPLSDPPLEALANINIPIDLDEDSDGDLPNLFSHSVSRVLDSTTTMAPMKPLPASPQKSRETLAISSINRPPVQKTERLGRPDNIIDLCDDESEDDIAPSAERPRNQNVASTLGQQHVVIDLT